MAALLAALRATSRNRHRQAAGTSPAYLDALLAAFSGQVSPPSDTSVRTTAVMTGFHPGLLAEPLSARELDVLRLLSDGRSNAEIARDLFVEQSTVKTHLIHLYRKLSVSSRTQAISRAPDSGCWTDCFARRETQLWASLHLFSALWWTRTPQVER